MTDGFERFRRDRFERRAQGLHGADAFTKQLPHPSALTEGGMQRFSTRAPALRLCVQDASARDMPGTEPDDVEAVLRIDGACDERSEPLALADLEAQLLVDVRRRRPLHPFQ